MTEPKSVDDVLVAVMQNTQAPVQPIPAAIPEPVDHTIPQTSVEQSVENVSQEEVAPIAQPEQAIAPNVPQETQDVTSTGENPIDEYGNPVAKPKMYSEEEVQRMIRDRLSRGKHAEQQPTQQQVQQASKDFQQQPVNPDEPWDVQLQKFVDQRVEAKENEKAQRAREAEEAKWRAEQDAKQAEFQSRFMTGMQKYDDFEQVVKGKPITDAMLLGARNLENPAAFVYGAAKMHPQELERIARIDDPYTQAAEVGKLHERMVKQYQSNAQPIRPLESPRGDMPAKNTNQPSLDDRIALHAKQKQQRR